MAKVDATGMANELLSAAASDVYFERHRIMYLLVATKGGTNARRELTHRLRSQATGAYSSAWQYSALPGGDALRHQMWYTKEPSTTQKIFDDIMGSMYDMSLLFERGDFRDPV